MNLEEYLNSTDPHLFWRTDSGDILNLLDEALEKIDDLQKIIDRLPKTADGVPLATCEKVWILEDYGKRLQVIYRQKSWPERYPGRCYSTPEAAKEAKEKELETNGK